MKAKVVFSSFGRNWRALSCGALVLGSLSAQAAFPPGPADEAPINSMGVVKIMVSPKFQPVMANALGAGVPYPGYFNSDGRLYSPVVFDANTIIGRSAVHDNGSIPAAGEPIGLLGTLAKYVDYAQTPPEFVSPPAITREVFTEIRRMVLTTTGRNACSNENSGVPPYVDPRIPTVPAGWPMVLAGPDAGASLPALPHSIGQVQSKVPNDPSPYVNDFPAQSFFDVFTEVNLPPLGGFPGGILRNSQPLVVTNLNLPIFPPSVIYTHSPASSAAPLVFKNAGSAGAVTWVAGEVFGWLVLAGHGTALDCSDPSVVEAFVTNVLGKVGADLPGAPLPPQNIWKNGTGTGLWDTGTTPNWISPILWVDGADATFDSIGAQSTSGALVQLASSVMAHRMTFNVSNYTIIGSGNQLTMAGASPTIAANASSNVINASLYGTDGLTFSGGDNGTTVLLGDGVDANHYTGGTAVRSGTLVLKASGVSTSGGAYAVDRIDAIDAGATVRIGTENDGTSNVRPADGQIVRKSSPNDPSSGRLNLTGGTFDNNGDNNGIQYPPPTGTGTILNSSPYIRAVMKLVGIDGGTYVWNGQIMDGGPLATTTQGTAYQESVDMQGAQYVYHIGGSNSFSGFWRFSSGGQKVVMHPGGTLGYPTPVFCPARQILMNSGTLDLNGTRQKVGYVYTGNDAGSVITNGAFGTTSTLTACYNCTNLVAFNGAATPRGIRCALLDDPAAGGTLALTKEGVAIQPIGNYSGDGTPAQNNYHGDTTVNNGILEVLSVNGVSPNSAYRLNNPGILQLDYSGTANVRQLWINGVQQFNGTYGAAQTTTIIGQGTITVTGSTAVTTPTLNYAKAGNFLTLSWTGNFKLQAKTNNIIGIWSDYPGGTSSPVDVPLDATQNSVFFRLSN